MSVTWKGQISVCKGKQQETVHFRFSAKKKKLSQKVIKEIFHSKIFFLMLHFMDCFFYFVFILIHYKNIKIEISFIY